MIALLCFVIALQLLILVKLDTPVAKELHPIVRETLQAVAAKEKAEPKLVKPRGWTEVRKKAEAAE